MTRVIILVTSIVQVMSVFGSQVWPVVSFDGETWPAGLEHNMRRLEGIYAPAAIPGKPHARVFGVVYPDDPNTVHERYMIYTPLGQSTRAAKAFCLNSLFTAGSFLATLGCCFLTYKVGKWEFQQRGGISWQLLTGGWGFPFTAACSATVLVAGQYLYYFGRRAVQNYKKWLELRRTEFQDSANATPVPQAAIASLKRTIKLPQAPLYYHRMSNQDYVNVTEAGGYDCAPVYEQHGVLSRHLTIVDRLTDSLIKQLDSITTCDDLKKLCAPACGKGDFQFLDHYDYGMFSGAIERPTAESLAFMAGFLRESGRPFRTPDQWASMFLNPGPWLQANFSNKVLQESIKAVIRVKPCYKRDLLVNSIDSYDSEDLYFAIPTRYGLFRAPVKLRHAIEGMLRRLTLDGNTFGWSGEYMPDDSTEDWGKVRADLIKAFNEILGIVGIDPCTTDTVSADIQKKWRGASLQLHPDKFYQCSGQVRGSIRAYQLKYQLRGGQEIIQKLNELRALLCPVNVTARCRYAQAGRART